MDKKCYDCKHRGHIPGDAHSCCKHPDLGEADRFECLMAILASVGRVYPAINKKYIDFGIKANPHGIQRGWFNWPYNFDPVWLENCNKFEEK